MSYFKSDPWKQKKCLFFKMKHYVELLETKTTDTKL